jgi:hypothetical protein
MRLREAGRTERWRIAVFGAVLALHFLAGFLISTKGSIRIARLRAVDAPLSLFWISQQRLVHVPVATAEATPDRNPKKSPASANIEPPSGAMRPESNNAITLPLDLSTDADAAARRQSDKEANEKRWRNLAGPSDSQLEWWRNNAPRIRDYRQLGDDERAEGGELITWMNDKCYYTTHGPTTFGMPQTGSVCKDPPKPETDLFKNMRKQLDASAKNPNP